MASNIFNKYYHYTNIIHNSQRMNANKVKKGQKIILCHIVSNNRSFHMFSFRMSYNKNH